MSRRLQHLFAVLVLVALFAPGCAKHTGIVAPTLKDPVVFDDGFGAAVDFQAFLGSKLDAVAIDTTIKYSGAASLKVTVPGPSDPTGGYAGGAFTTNRARDLSTYNALTFWVKASRPITMDVAGLGNDNTGTSRFEAKWGSVPVGMTWSKVVIPIPLAARLTDEKGLFFFAEGPESGAGSTIWFDDVKFDNLLTITNPRPQIPTSNLAPDVGSTLKPTGTKVVFAVDGVDQTIDAMPGYFTFVSSNDTVAAGGEGSIRILAIGDATITAKLGDTPATGALTLRTNGAPTSAPPRPTLPAADVISLLSGAYTNVTVDTWSTTWDVADVADVTIGADAVKKYTGLVYAGIECTSQMIDASSMTAFHLDVWAPRGTTFKVKLVDFGPDGAFGTDDSEHELTFNAASTPAFTPTTWSRLEIPLSAFTGLAARAHIAQIIISGDPGTAYLDNVYFHR